MTIHDVAGRFGVLIAACALLGAGPPNALGSLDAVIALAGSAQAYLPPHANNVRSYRSTFSSRHDGPFIVINDLERHAFKMTSARDGSTMYMAGMTSYFQLSPGKWTKFDGARYLRMAAKSPKQGGARTAPATPKSRHETYHDLPDRRLNGVLLGAYSVTFRVSALERRLFGSDTLTATCLYEKTTGRLRTCDTPGQFTMTFDRYNDPSNRVEVPVAALNAPAAYLPSP